MARRSQSRGRGAKSVLSALFPISTLFRVDAEVIFRSLLLIALLTFMGESGSSVTAVEDKVEGSCGGSSVAGVEDETCLMQLNTEVTKSASRAEMKSRASGGREESRSWLDMFNMFAPIWDYEMDAGGMVDTDPVAKCGNGTKVICGTPPPPKYPPHPLWHPEWKRMLSGGALRAGACLWAAGILCCAGGIGGGGIYVTVLMVFGNLSVHDAIPLSKVVVFAASAPSLVLNLLKSISKKELGEGEAEDDGTGQARTLIDWNLCRIVVPWALIGTLFGVFLNNIIPGHVIIGLLCAILIGITIMLLRTGYDQHCKEKAAEAEEAEKETLKDGESSPSAEKKEGTMAGTQENRVESSSASADVTLTSGGATNKDLTVTSGGDQGNKSDGECSQTSSQKNKPKKYCPDANVMPKGEVAFAISMLVVIILCGVFHLWAEKCAKYDYQDPPDKPCHNPLAQAISLGQMVPLKNAGVLAGMGVGAMVVAICYCSVLGVILVRRIMSTGQVYGSFHNFESIGHDYQWPIMLGYITMSVVTGSLAGLVGIGGGLIFSPVFIMMKVDTHIAVASSATCVIFTSSSTTFQYLFTDRIIVSLVFSFCIPHLLAAYTGTKLVHYIQDNYGAKKSWITWIVALGVGISCILAVMKFINPHAAAD